MKNNNKIKELKETDNIKFCVLSSSKEKKEFKIKYDEKLSYLNKYVKNKYIYDIILNYCIPFKYNNITYNVTINSSINIYEGAFITRILKIIKPKNCLEVGLAMGFSGMYIVNQLIKNKQKSTLISLDPFQDTQWFDLGNKNIQKIIKKNKTVDHIHMKKYSQDVMPDIYKLKGNIFDFILVDGDHGYEGVKKDIINSTKLIKLNGIILLDDVSKHHNEVLRATNEIFLNNTKFIRIMINKNKIIEYDVNLLDDNDKSIAPCAMWGFKKILE
jgi:predicted O-methyltransferase YrrM